MMITSLPRTNSLPGLLAMLVAGVAIGFGAGWWARRDAVPAPAPLADKAPASVPLPFQDLAFLRNALQGRLSDDMSREDFHAKLKWLREYYQGDSYALALLAASAGDTERNRFENYPAWRDEIKAGLAQVEKCERDIKLLELKMLHNLGLACSGINLGDRNSWLDPWKEGMDRFTKRAWPASVLDPHQWRLEYSSAYREICWDLAQRAQAEEVKDLLVHTPVYLHIAEIWPRASKGMLPSLGASERHSQDTIKWLNVIIKDGKPPEEERIILEQAMELVNRWHERQTKGARRAIFEELEKERGEAYKLTEG